MRSGVLGQPGVCATQATPAAGQRQAPAGGAPARVLPPQPRAPLKHPGCSSSGSCARPAGSAPAGREPPLHAAAAAGLGSHAGAPAAVRRLPCGPGQLRQSDAGRAGRRRSRVARGSSLDDGACPPARRRRRRRSPPIHPSLPCRLLARSAPPGRCRTQLWACQPHLRAERRAGNRQAGQGCAGLRQGVVWLLQVPPSRNRGWRVQATVSAGSRAGHFRPGPWHCIGALADPIHAISVPLCTLPASARPCRLGSPLNLHTYVAARAGLPGARRPRWGDRRQLRGRGGCRRRACGLRGRRRRRPPRRLDGEPSTCMHGGRLLGPSRGQARQQSAALAC